MVKLVLALGMKLPLFLNRKILTNEGFGEVWQATQFIKYGAGPRLSLSRVCVVCLHV